MSDNSNDFEESSKLSPISKVNQNRKQILDIDLQNISNFEMQDEISFEIQNIINPNIQENIQIQNGFNTPININKHHRTLNLNINSEDVSFDENIFKNIKLEKKLKQKKKKIKKIYEKYRNFNKKNGRDGDGGRDGRGGRGGDGAGGGVVAFC